MQCNAEYIGLEKRKKKDCRRFIVYAFIDERVPSTYIQARTRNLDQGAWFDKWNSLAAKGDYTNNLSN